MITHLFLIASELLQKSLVVYLHVFFSVKNQKIHLFQKERKNGKSVITCFFYYTSFIRELLVSESRRNNKDNENIFTNQILVNGQYTNLSLDVSFLCEDSSLISNFHEAF